MPSPRPALSSPAAVADLSDWDQAVAEILSQNAPVGSPNGGVDTPLNEPACAGDRISTFSGIVGAFVEHLEVMIHLILFERGIYPRDMFMAARKYNAAVKMCRSIRVVRFVRDVVKQVGKQLEEADIKYVSIVILSENWQPLERFGFNVSSFPKVSEEHREEEWWRYNKTNEGGKAMKMPLAELYEQFRAVVMQMSVCSGKLGKLPENCTWTVSLELMEGTEAPPKDYASHWVVSERQETGWKSNNEAALDSDGVKSMHLRSIAAGIMDISVWVEESKAKAKLSA